MKTKLIALTLILFSCTAWAAEETKPEPLKQAVADMIQAATKSAGEAKDFLAGQIPDVIRQLLMWKMAESIVYCLIGIAMMIIWIKAARKYFAYGKSEEWDFDSSEGMVPATMFGGLLSVFWLGGTIAFLNTTWLQIWIAPKVYLIEFARDLIK